MKSWREEAKDIEIAASHDVVVCGGGPAGCAAALTAARAGADTLLIEREGHLGGATVNQLVSVILSSNGVDLQGVWHEWYKELKRLNAVRVKPAKDGFKAVVDPEQVKFAWDNLLSLAGVRILHRAYSAAPAMEGDRVAGALLETCAGRKAVMAKCVVDATGDGVIAAAAGVPFDQGAGASKCAMSMTKAFRLGGIAWPEGWPDEEGVEKLRAGWREAVASGELSHPVASTNERIIDYMKYRCWELPEYRSELLSVMSRVLDVDPLNPFALSEAEREGREQARQCAQFYCRRMPGFEKAYLLDTAAHIGVRSSRRFKGAGQVSYDDVVNFRKHPHSIAKASGDIDIWPMSYTAATVDRSSEEAKKRKREISEGGHYDIRYGCLLPEKTDGLLFAGRCVSASHLAQSSLRLQQTCQSLGEAAGLAAAISAKEGLTPREIPEEELCRRLEKIRANSVCADEIASAIEEFKRHARSR